jgi:hypothetical protein
MDEPTNRAAFVAGLTGEELPRLLLVHLDDPGFAHLLWLLDLHIHAAYLRENRTEPSCSCSWSPPPPPQGFPQQEEERRKSQAVFERKSKEVAIHYVLAVLTSDMPTTTARLGVVWFRGWHLGDKDIPNQLVRDKPIFLFG